MPTYQYACTACDHRLEAVQSFSDDPLTQCPQCEGRLRKLFGSVGVVFKGPGFYRTDSRNANGQRRNGAQNNGAQSNGAQSNGASDSGGSGSGKSDSAKSTSAASGGKDSSASSGSAQGTGSKDKAPASTGS